MALRTGDLKEGRRRKKRGRWTGTQDAGGGREMERDGEMQREMQKMIGRERWAHMCMQLHMYGKTDGQKEGR